MPRLINSLTSIKTLRSMLTKILAHIAVFVDQLVFVHTSVLWCTDDGHVLEEAGESLRTEGWPLATAPSSGHVMSR